MYEHRKKLKIRQCRFFVWNDVTSSFIFRNKPQMNGVEMGEPQQQQPQNKPSPKCPAPSKLCRRQSACWGAFALVVLAMEIPFGLRAPYMFHDRHVGYLTPDGDLIVECNATLLSENKDCYCGHDNCHKLRYDLAYEMANGTVLHNEWSWGCHCAWRENVVVKGAMGCIVQDGQALEGYGRDICYKISVMTAFIAVPIGLFITTLVLSCYIWAWST